MKASMKVDLGCGSSKAPGAVGIDIHPGPGVDLVADLQEGIPLPSGSVDEITSNHFLEHLPDLTFFLEEIYRVLAPGGVLRAQVPYFTSNYAAANPTHLRPFTLDTLDYFTPRCSLNFHTTARFEAVSKRLVFAYGRLRFLNPLVDPLVNAFPRLYERLFAHILPCDGLVVVMRKPDREKSMSETLLGMGILEIKKP